MAKINCRDGGLVFSTEQGRISQVVSSTQKAVAGSLDGIVRISRETKGRKGKGVTRITGLALTPAQLKEMALSLKQKCGCGGTVKDGVIEIQGDHRDLLMAELAALGHKVKRAGA